MCLFGKEPETLIFVFALVLKKPDKTLLSYRTSRDIVGIEAAKTLGGGCMQTILSCSFLL